MIFRFPSEMRRFIHGFGFSVTEEDATIKGSRLPTYEQVLRCFKYHQERGLPENKLSRLSRHAAKIVLDQVTVFYKKANIPMISEKTACDKILALSEKK